MSDYKSGDVQKLFKVSSETVRQWAMEFEEYLSPSASPGAGRMRLFNVEDLRVFALVSEMKEQGKTFEDAHAWLKLGKRGEIPEGDGAAWIELREAMEMRIVQQKLVQVESERDELSLQVNTLREKMGRLEGELERADAATEKSDQTIRDQQEKINSLQQEILNLSKQMAKLEVRLEIAQEDKKDG